MIARRDMQMSLKTNFGLGSIQCMVRMYLLCLWRLDNTCKGDKLQINQYCGKGWCVCGAQ